MHDMLAWPWEARTAVTLAFALAILAQSLGLALSFYRHLPGRRRALECALEIAVLLQMLTLSLLHGQGVLQYELGVLAPQRYGALRVGMACATCLFGSWNALAGRRLSPLLVIPASGALLPAAEALAGRAYSWLYLAALLFWLLRAVCVGLARYRDIRTGISAYSIKDAIDSLRSGILFCAPDGHILLINRRMQRLMQAFTGELHRNGEKFYAALRQGTMQPGCERLELEGQMAGMLPEGGVWLFTKSDLRIRSRRYIQLSAADVSEIWRLTAQRREQNDALQASSDALRETIANLHLLCREGERQKAKMRAHDMLGQKLSLLLRALQTDQPLEEAALRSLAEAWPDSPDAPAQPTLEELRRVFGSIGVDIRLEGAWPEELEIARAFAAIAREGVTNAVRHAFAAEVRICASEEGGHYRLSVRNDGLPPSGPIVEGNGLRGMRETAQALGGALEIAEGPPFSVSVCIAKGAGHV